MADRHKFLVGQSVQLVGSHIGPRQSTRFEIVRLMPTEHGMRQYRIRSLTDGQERMAIESELA